MEAMKKGGKVKQKQKQKQKQQQTVNVYVGTRKGTRKPRKTQQTQPPPFRPSFALQDPGFIRLMNPQMPGQQSQLLPPVQPLLSTPSGLNEPVGPKPLPQLSQPVGPQPLPQLISTLNTRRPSPESVSSSVPTPSIPLGPDRIHPSLLPVPPPYPPPPIGRNRKSPLSPGISPLAPVLPAPLPMNIENASPSAPIPLENAPLSAQIPLIPKPVGRSRKQLDDEPQIAPDRKIKEDDFEKELMAILEEGQSPPRPKSESPLYQPGSDIEYEDEEEKEPLPQKKKKTYRPGGNPYDTFYADTGQKLPPSPPAIEKTIFPSVGDERRMKKEAIAMYVEPDPLSPEFKVEARVPTVRPTPPKDKLTWPSYYLAVKGGLTRAKAIFGTKNEKDPNVAQFRGMVYQQYLKYLAS